MKYTTLFLMIFVMGCTQKKENAESGKMLFENETHLKNVQMLTYKGKTTEAYFNFSETKLIFQSTHDNFKCDQIFTMNLDGSGKKLVSTGEGKTTCSYFLPNEKIIHANTHGKNKNCPTPPDYSKGYVWKVYNSYDLYIANSDDSNPVVLNSAEGYDAEATVSPKGDNIVFTSTRNGELDIYSTNSN